MDSVKGMTLFDLKQMIKLTGAIGSDARASLKTHRTSSLSNIIVSLGTLMIPPDSVACPRLSKLQELRLFHRDRT
jgi:hypothetical protein